MSLICKDCKRETTHLIGGECEVCCYNNQELDRLISCDTCGEKIGYYRNFDEYQEPNNLNMARCVGCM